MRCTRKFLFGTSILASLLTVAAPVLAQTAPQEPDTSELEEVIVTGSLIRRSAATAPTPLIQASREEIAQQGEQNIVDFLTDIPALQNSQVPEDTTGGIIGVGGLALLNLRNLGIGRTLVLVDGMRHVGGQPGTPSVDVDTIPTPLIQSVEIVTGGASSLYGADAVSGVVNFIMRRDFEGIELDIGLSQLAQNRGAMNQRMSALVGQNLFDDRLNVYAFGEYQTSDVVNDDMLEIGWLEREERLVTLDYDPASAPNDYVTDIVRVGGLRSLSRPFGGILTIANGQRPSPASDPDIGFSGCGTNAAGTALAAESQNSFSSARCFPVNTGYSYRFQPGGAAYAVDIGGGLVPTGTPGRTQAIGGNGDSLVAQDVNRLPEQEAKRFQFGTNFQVNDHINFFSELKYVEETNVDIFQPHFSDVGIRPFAAGEQSVVGSDLVSGRIGLDNAYLDPAVRTQILNNVRTVYNAAGAVIGTQADPRASFRLFSYDLGFRPTIAERELTRFVGGFRGDFDSLFMLKDGQWEVGYTRGIADSVNTETETIDLQRWFFSADAVRDPLNETGRGANAIVCRVQLLAARNQPVINQATGTAYSPTDPTIRDCVPSNIFGLGGQTVARDYILTQLITRDRNEQSDVRAFISGDLWDFWGAGPIGIAAGAEYREERWKQDLTEFGDRILFGNGGDDRTKVGFDVAEGFLELRIPLLTDVPFAETLEFSGAYRYSDYSTGEQTETYSTSMFWRPLQDIALRGTYGEAVRAPTLTQLYSAPFDTFPQITDACSINVINSTADERIRNNRIRNCAAKGIPTTYVDPQPTTSNIGKTGSNPDLLNERSTSYTISAILTPRMFPGFSAVVDYYSIDIEDAIATLSIQQLVGLCYDDDQINEAACSKFTRDPTTFEIVDFLQGPFNYAGLRARGIDFEVRYALETEDLLGKDLGRLNFSLTGNNLIRLQNFTNPSNPTLPTDIDGTANNPRVRFRTNTTWSQGPWQISWRADFQRGVPVVAIRSILSNADSRDYEFLKVPNFWQHDVSLRYDLNDSTTLRAGVTNLFDAEPSIQAGLADQFDLFGRRYFGGLTYRY